MFWPAGRQPHASHSHRLYLLPVGQRPPPRPLRQRQVSAQLFDGKVMDSHTANDGSKYIRVLFGSATEDDPVALIDAEFSFPAGKLLHFICGMPAMWCGIAFCLCHSGTAVPQRPSQPSTLLCIWQYCCVVGKHAACRQTSLH